MDLLESVFNHIVLPAKLPGNQDDNIDGVNGNILNRLLDACDSIAKLSGQDLAKAWELTHHSLRTCRQINQGRLERASLLEAFHNLQSNHYLILHVVEQNAALLLRRHIK